MSFGLYYGNEVVINFAALDFEDMRADEFVRITPSQEEFGTIVGADGSVTRFRNYNTLFDVQLGFKRSSKCNTLMSGIHVADMLAGGGAGVASLIIKDLNGSSIFASEKAWIKGFPEAGNGKEVGPDPNWMLAAIVLPGQYIIGGNQL